ncbi:MAG TPA: phosphotransferase [Candidatus Dormibacteraeota bacterium]|nr:phosphotransferase [Candidatus Dormibacteraeota bacterium]
MESSSATLRLPRRVRSAAMTAIGGTRLDGELAWMSWAGTVWRLAGESGAVYVKRAAELSGERDRLAWLRGRLPVPEVVGFFHVVGDDWLMTREVPGVPLYHASVDLSPERVARVFGEILRGIHCTDATDCPFGIRKRGHVLIHGDYCLPNVLVSQGKLSGLIDVGGTGLGDPRQDLAAGVWTLQYNFGKGFARDFLDAYGAPAMTDQEIERLRRKYGR